MGTKLRATAAKAQLPWLEHNPVLTFTLRDDVVFHDGHAFDADDVRFTYDAIMDPRNLSPRRADFEPIQSLEVLDATQVRVVYKRLYAPALYSWTMGILPEHLLNRAQLDAQMVARKVTGDAVAAFGMRDMPFNRAAGWHRANGICAMAW